MFKPSSTKAETNSAAPAPVRVFENGELPIKLISTDFDGTLHADHEDPPVPLDLQQMIAALQARGAKWVINTGRDLSSLLETLGRARLRIKPDFLVVVEREIYCHREAQYIEVPDSYSPLRNIPPAAPAPATAVVSPQVMIAWVSGQQPRVFITNANFLDLTTSVFPGDVLSVPEFHLLLTVTAFAQVPAPGLTLANGTPVQAVEVGLRNPVVLQLALGATFPMTPGPAPTPTYATTAFGFNRQPQPAVGEPTLQLTGDMVIDGPISQPAISGPTGTPVDVLFAANGEVMNATGGRTVLWVRDVRLPFVITGTRAQYEGAGQMALIVVYSKTGAIATQPVLLPPNPDPYGATRDAVNTGL